MSKLIKDGDVILDMTATKVEKTKEAFLKLQAIETIMEKYEIETPADLEKIIEDYDTCAMFTMFFQSYLKTKGLTLDFKTFLRKFEKKPNVA